MALGSALATKPRISRHAPAARVSLRAVSVVMAAACKAGAWNVSVDSVLWTAAHSRWHSVVSAPVPLCRSKTLHR